jgi:hypothetical protein
MPHLKRRQFLQVAGATLAALGINQWDIQHQGHRYGRVLAQGTPGRKLALLVGINDYQASDVVDLKGCHNDIEMQRQLLVHRFGFNPKDILMLTDKQPPSQQPTRQNILTAFEDHLIQQAKSGDVVVFHFSGHGSQVRDVDCDEPDCQNSTLVPLNYSLPDQQGQVQDIMGHTLFLLMKALKTDNITVVLDSCYSGGGKRGNVIVRSRTLGDTPFQPVPAELVYQHQWLSKLNLSDTAFKQERRTGVAKGVVIASARRDQEAVDVAFPDFYAGAFTYLLTRYLWQQTGGEPVSRVIANVGRSTYITAGKIQQPELEFKPLRGISEPPIYFTSRQLPSAEAVVTQIQGNQVMLWLGGIESESLTAFEKDATFSLVDAAGRDQGLVQLEARNGLVGKGKLLQVNSHSTLQAGMLLQERIRSIPTNVTLKIGLDPTLGNETAQAQQALQSLRQIEALALQQGEVHYILGRINATYRQRLQQNKVADLPAVGCVGLFLPNLVEIVPESFGAAQESVKDAIVRLRPKLESLLAARMIKLVLNAASSRLNVTASLRLMHDATAIVAKSFTIRGSKEIQATDYPAPTRSTKQLQLGQEIQFQIQNKEAFDLYITVLVLSAKGEIDIVFPNTWSATEDAARVAAGQTQLIPQPGQDQFELTVEQTGIGEALVIASRAPIRKALKALQDLAARRQLRRGPMPVDLEPVAVIAQLLDDLNVTRSPSSSRETKSVNQLDATKLAALSITFEVA